MKTIQNLLNGLGRVNSTPIDDYRVGTCVHFTIGLAMFAALAGCGGSSGSGAVDNVTPVKNACARPAAGSVVQNPPALFSKDGMLSVNLSFQSVTDAEGRTLYCFMTPSGLENPTLQVHPGDRLKMKITNNTPSAPVVMQMDPPNCGGKNQTGSSLNLHLHGTNTPPSCHQDQVIKTLINAGKTFAYDFRFPSDEPPGLYWFHPHIHGSVEPMLQGGGSGGIIVDGIEKIQPAVAGLNQEVLIIRDQELPGGSPTPGGNVPSWDLTLNSVPISYPQEIPAVLQMGQGEQQLWRVSNSSADTILDLQVVYDGVAQNLQIVALDGVPTGSQNGTQQGQIVNASDILIPTAGRAEFIVTGPGAGVSNASLVTLGIDTGPDGDNDPPRTIATIQTTEAGAPLALSSRGALPRDTRGGWKQRFAGLAAKAAETTRTLYFSEDNPDSQFFITLDGATPELFDPNNPPAIVTNQGSVEEWTIQNRSLENHEFHIHQIHFLVVSQDNFEVNGSQPVAYIDGQLLDTIQIPFWDGNPGDPYPSVRVRMDFEGIDIGDFVYHCHIAEHEDAGMMAIIRVTPSSATAILEKLKIGLASLRWFGEAANAGPLWCTNGSYSNRRPLRRRQAGGVSLAPSNDLSSKLATGRRDDFNR
jgi:FtsP/CotA-like multicopper oxidase with cupredoxin domain